jgi:hypothetical protein
MVGLVRACVLGVFLGLACALDSSGRSRRLFWACRLVFHFGAMWGLGSLRCGFFRSYRGSSAQIPLGLGMSLCLRICPLCLVSGEVFGGIELEVPKLKERW